MNVVAWFPDGVSFVVGCYGGSVRLLDMRSNRVLSQYCYHNYLKEKQSDDNNDSNNSMVRTSTNTPIITHLTHNDHDNDIDIDNKNADILNAVLEHKDRDIEPLKARYCLLR